MNERILAVAEQLLLIERELRRLGWWSAHSPSDEALGSCEPFCVDTLDFAQWLQWIFLPRMKELLESGGPLPSVSGICAMAEVVYRERPVEVKELLVILGRFDQLIGKAR
jgi:uncharacterized protein YqcC (DUF446 family)